MARHYSTRDFSQHLPSGPLVRYFALPDVLAELDEAGLAEGKKGALFDAWLGLPLTKWQAMDAERQHCTALRETC